MTDAPRNLTDLGVEVCRRANAAHTAHDEAPDARSAGLKDGWATAHRIIQQVLHHPYDDEGQALRLVADALEENRRRIASLTRAIIPPADRTARIDALADATMLTLATLGALDGKAAVPDDGDPPAPAAQPDPDGDDLADWSRYPIVPVSTVADTHELALFLGGDETSFTGDLLRLIAKADPDNLNRLGRAFPRHVRAYLMWRACAPVPARTLVSLLEATSMTERHRR